MIFFYNQPLSEEEKELFNLASKKFISEFPAGKATCALKIIQYPGVIPKNGFCVYERYEPDPFDNEQSDL